MLRLPEPTLLEYLETRPTKKHESNLAQARTLINHTLRVRVQIALCASSVLLPSKIVKFFEKDFQPVAVTCHRHNGYDEDADRLLNDSRGVSGRPQEFCDLLGEITCNRRVSC